MSLVSKFPIPTGVKSFIIRFLFRIKTIKHAMKWSHRPILTLRKSLTQIRIEWIANEERNLFFRRFDLVSSALP